MSDLKMVCHILPQLPPKKTKAPQAGYWVISAVEDFLEHQDESFYTTSNTNGRNVWTTGEIIK